MAIFHLELRHISRKNKSGGIKSAASIVAYRERCKIGEFNYSNKTDFVTSFCLFPTKFSNTDFAEKMRDPALFAQEIELIEKRKDSQLFDELILALPHELALEQNKVIIEKLIGEFYVPKNQMARVFIHRTKSNLHAHVLIPQRPLESTEKGLGFGKKIREDFSKGKPKSSEKVISLRSRWAELVNQALSDVGEDKQISHLSLKELKKKAERVFDFKTAEFYDRSPLYLPVSAYKRTEFIVSKDDRFALDFKAMHLARTFAARRAKPETLTFEDLLEEQDFWRKIEESNRLRIGSIRLARKFAKRAEKSVFRKNAVTKFFEKNYETTRDTERGFENAKTSDSRAQKHTTQLNLNSAGNSEYNRLNAVGHRSEVRESYDSRDVYGRSGCQTNYDWECGRNRLGSENPSWVPGADFESRNPNPHTSKKREVFNTFTTSGHRRSYYSGNSKCFESTATNSEPSKSEREKNYRRTLPFVPKRRKRVS